MVGLLVLGFRVYGFGFRFELAQSFLSGDTSSSIRPEGVKVRGMSLFVIVVVVVAVVE